MNEQSENPANNRRIDVRELSELARIALDEGELREIELELEGKLRFIDRIFGVRTEDVEPTERVIPCTTATRDDAPKSCAARDLMLANVPDSEDGFVRVPTVVTGEEGA